MGKFYINSILLVLLVTVSAGCQDDVDENSPDWLIPSSEIYDGGVGRDGIPALVNPETMPASEITYLDDDDLVIGIEVNGERRAYPHKILDWHEIINDELGGEPFAITYCPLTGSGIAWSREVNGEISTFGVSGLLYNSNLIPYDRATGSHWAQMGNTCVNGSLIGDSAVQLPVIETTWSTWVSSFPESSVVSTNTGYSRNYDVYPYGDYKDNHDILLFPVNYLDKRLDTKERVLGVVVNRLSKVYSISAFGNGNAVIHDEFNGANLVITGNSEMNWGRVFLAEDPAGVELEFTAVKGDNQVVMRSADGTEWDLFGNAVTGPLVGAKLKSASAFISYWFAWGAFYPGADIN